MTLNSICDVHGHDPGLPDRELRAHVLAAATRVAQQMLHAHGYGDVDRSLEILHVSVEDASTTSTTNHPTELGASSPRCETCPAVRPPAN